jgi:hypothetical protein
MVIKISMDWPFSHYHADPKTPSITSHYHMIAKKKKTFLNSSHYMAAEITSLVSCPTHAVAMLFNSFLMSM